eukprot:gene13559-3961_t
MFEAETDGSDGGAEEDWVASPPKLIHQPAAAAISLSVGICLRMEKLTA